MGSVYAAPIVVSPNHDTDAATPFAKSAQRGANNGWEAQASTLFNADPAECFEVHELLDSAAHA